MGYVDSNYIRLLEMMADFVTKDDLMFNGFESLYGNKQLRPPVMQYANGDFRTIHVGWSAPIGLSNPSHYLLQVSDNGVDWRGLCFDGSSFGYEIGTLTTVFSTNMAHTRIPFNGEEIRILYYRAATITKDGRISDWSEPIVGNTFFIELSDIRDSFFSYPLQGTIHMSSEMFTGQFDYVADGSISITGGVSWDGWFDYIAYTINANIAITGQFSKEQEVDVVETGNGVVYSGGLFWTDTSIKYYYITNNQTYGITLTDIISTRDGSPASVVIGANGGKARHYGQPTSQMIALEDANYIDYYIVNEDYF